MLILRKYQLFLHKGNKALLGPEGFFVAYLIIAENRKLSFIMIIFTNEQLL